MATLIAVYNNGGCVGRCDAKCYGAAEGSKCDCVCNGKNHAAGKDQAMDNVRREFEPMLDAFCARHGIDKCKAFLNPALQPELFEGATNDVAC